MIAPQEPPARDARVSQPFPLCEVWRGDLVESRHHGALCIVRADGRELVAGATDRPTYPRSALKPLQALALLETQADLRLGLGARHRALITASHSADPLHVAALEELLAAGEIPAAALDCGPHPPLDPAAAAALVREEVRPAAIHNNCSGKHAGMLLLARELKAPLEGYLDLDHPVQGRIREVIAALCDTEPGALVAGLDGCSAPAYQMTPRTMAQAFTRLASGEGLEGARAAAIERLFEAVHAEPHFLAGSRMLDQAIVRAVGPGVLAKRGAEGFLAIALRPPAVPSPIGLALKVEDGNLRALGPVVRPLLEALGVSWKDVDEHLPDGEACRLLNSAGREVGALRPAGALRDICTRLSEHFGEP